MRAVPLKLLRMAVSAQCSFLAGLCSCTADAVVLRAATLEPRDASMPEADASKPPLPTPDGGTMVFGCRSESNGGNAILSEILGRLNEDFLTREKPRCSTDADCSQTFVTPACDEATGACVPCADPAQQVAFGVVLGACLTTNAARCCRDPEAPMDCIVKACNMVGCGGK